MMNNRISSDFAFLRVLCGRSFATFAVKSFFFLHGDKGRRVMESTQ
jgi:hypothetical protein